MGKVTGSDGSGGIDRAGIVDNGGRIDGAASQPPAPQKLGPPGFDGLWALMRGRSMSGEKAAAFGLSAGTVATQARTMRAPVIGMDPLHFTPSLIHFPRLTAAAPEEARLALALGKTVESIDGAPTDEHPNGIVSERTTLFVEVPSRPGVKCLFDVRTRYYDPSDPAALRAKRGVSMQSAADERTIAEPPSIGIIADPVTGVIGRLSAEEAAAFGTNAMLAEVPGAEAVGQKTQFRRTFGWIPGLGVRKMRAGVTTHVADLPPSAEHPNGITGVCRMVFAEVQERRGFKVKLFERERTRSADPQ